MMVPVHFGQHQVLAIVDTAAQATVVSEDLYRKLVGSTPCEHNARSVKLVGLGGKETDGWRVPNLTFRLGNLVFEWSVIVAPVQVMMLHYLIDVYFPIFWGLKYTN